MSTSPTGERPVPCPLQTLLDFTVRVTNWHENEITGKHRGHVSVSDARSLFIALAIEQGHKSGESAVFINRSQNQGTYNRKRHRRLMQVDPDYGAKYIVLQAMVSDHLTGKLEA